MTLAAERQNLANVRAVVRGRTGRPTPGDNVYKIYELALLVLIVIFPVSRAVMMGLAIPEVSVAVSANLTVNNVTLALLVLALIVVVSCRLRGPVVPSAAYIELVVSSPLARAVTLRRSFTRNRFGFSLIAVVGAVVLVGGSLFSGSADTAGVALFLVAAAVGAWQISLLWLVGQLSTQIRPQIIRLLIVILGITGVLSAIPAASWVAPWLGPWGWVSQTWQAVAHGPDVQAWVAEALLIVGLGATMWSAQLLAQLSYDDLATQSQRWGVASMLAGSGDIKSAANRLKALPRLGRHWRFRFPGSPVRALILRDVIGLARFPFRTGFFLLASAGTGALLAYSFIPESGGALLAFAVPVLLYFTVGGWSEGLRFHASMIGSSSASGIGPGRQVLIHLIVPAVTTAILVVSGAVTVAAITHGLDIPEIATWALGLVMLSLVLQCFSALKGLLPIELLTPVVTPLGDLSMVNVGIWLADAVIIMFVVGGGLTSTAIHAGDNTNAIVLLACAGILMAWWSWARFQRLMRP